jgi:hypothetical protein
MGVAGVGGVAGTGATGGVKRGSDGGTVPSGRERPSCGGLTGDCRWGSSSGVRWSGVGPVLAGATVSGVALSGVALSGVALSGGSDQVKP